MDYITKIHDIDGETIVGLDSMASQSWEIISALPSIGANTNSNKARVLIIWGKKEELL